MAAKDDNRLQIKKTCLSESVIPAEVLVIPAHAGISLRKGRCHLFWPKCLSFLRMQESR